MFITVSIAVQSIFRVSLGVPSPIDLTAHPSPSTIIMHSQRKNNAITPYSNYNVERVDNGLFGDNYGTINQYGTERSLLHALKPIPDASHERNRKRSPPDSSCMEGTRTAAVREITEWADQDISSSSGDNSPILWLYGYVGCGKSAIAQAVSEIFSKQNGWQRASSSSTTRAKGA